MTPNSIFPAVKWTTTVKIHILWQYWNWSLIELSSLTALHKLAPSTFASEWIYSTFCLISHQSVRFLLKFTQEMAVTIVDGSEFIKNSEYVTLVTIVSITAIQYINSIRKKARMCWIAYSILTHEFLCVFIFVFYTSHHDEQRNLICNAQRFQHFMWSGQAAK